ncbi:MAG TPA: AhpC/TSA family protein, partial [Longilinea sp.]|nr:AhpC/TSA family protein [Longilinea sp.]
AFTRHFGCTQCKEMLSELVEGKEKIESAGLAIAVIMQGTPEATAKFAVTFAPGLQVFADPELKAYKAYKLEKGNIFQTFINGKVWAAIARARKKGYYVERPPAGQDAMQMAGFFVISTAGKIELPFYYDNIADHPPLELLLDGVLSTKWDAAFDGPVGPGVKKSQSKTGRGK